MAKYRFKRKCYGFVEAAQNTLGGVTKGVGSALDSTPSAIVGGLYSGAKLGGMIGNVLDAAGVPFGGLLGYGAGALIGSTAVRGLGKGLKEAGNSMQM